MTQDANFERFNLRHLRYFLAVCDAGSFRAASSTLHVAQSAVSRRVADLEEIFGLRLFERTSRGVALSAAGAALRSSALNIVGEIEEANATLTCYAEGKEGLLRIGFFGMTSRLGFVPELIARFREAQPSIRLEFVPLPTGQIDAAELARLEIAFVENGPIPASHRSHRLAAGEYMLALPLGHPLATQPMIPFAALCKEQLIGFPRRSNPAAYDRLIRAASASSRRLTIIDEQESECSRLAFAAAGMGIAIVSPLAIHHDQPFEVEYRSIADLVVPFELWLAVRKGAPAFANPLVETARALLADMAMLSRSTP